jgi:hypothetical protein
MTRAPWPGPRRGGPWAAKRLSQPGRTAYLTLPGDTAGGNLDIVKKNVLPQLRTGASHHEPGGTCWLPET